MGALELPVLIKGGVLSAFSIKLLVWGVSVTVAFSFHIISDYYF